MKTKNKLQPATLAVLTLFASITIAQAGSDKIRAAIEAEDVKFCAAVAHGDAAALAALYADDAMVLEPNADIVKGREAIQKSWQKTMDSGVKSLKIKTLTVEADDDLACETGYATLFDANGKELETVKYLTVWKREKKQWKIHRDMWSSIQPATAK